MVRGLARVDPPFAGRYMSEAMERTCAESSTIPTEQVCAVDSIPRTVMDPTAAAAQRRRRAYSSDVSRRKPTRLPFRAAWMRSARARDSGTETPRPHS